MRTLAALVILGIVGPAPVALADTWRARPALEPGASSTCEDADVSALFFDLADTGSQLSVKTSSGETFLAPIGPDGSVNTMVKVPVGRRTLSVDLTGNVRTRQMEVFNKQYSCRFKLNPVQ